MSRMTIFNRNDGDANHAALVSSRLSNSVVSLLNYQGITLKTYRIVDAEDISEFDISFVSYLGCYIDNAGGGRDLPYFAGSMNLNGQSSCLQSCMSAGYQYAGTQYSNECWCSDSYGRYGVDPNGCNMACAGNGVEMCGGPNRNSVYTTTQSGILITNAPTNAPTAVPTTNNITFDPNLVHKVRVQQDFPNGLIIAEVQVFDHNNVNVALNKPASQSSTFSWHDASLAVNGNFYDFFDFSETTSNDQGE